MGTSTAVQAQGDMAQQAVKPVGLQDDSTQPHPVAGVGYKYQVVVLKPALRHPLHHIDSGFAHGMKLCPVTASAKNPIKVAPKLDKHTAELDHVKHAGVDSLNNKSCLIPPFYVLTGASICAGQG